ncbi:lysophospholipid acyltransferase family protein [uncultured Maribacter sp.]|uniref:lysophospholipid acyltransferase family protein n=1 Tax=uncultured Maribacter sp. TaxID=431308 RepID=UPI002639821E|nr:lysophospholipid acyltransferase family protein [uncultured Maribacter sp.]
MGKFFAYILTPIFAFFFMLVLLVFQPIQWVCLNIFGYKAHSISVNYFNLCLIRCTHIIGTTYKFNNPHNIPTNRPLIIVSNHQSMYEISPISWWMRKHHPKFVSKKELGKGIPSVSYNLNHGGSVLIDRNDGKQAIKEIAKLGSYIEEHNRSAVIFPEGTRSRTGHPKKFQTMGLKILIKKAPSALIVPISVNDSWKMLRYGKFPNGLGSRITIDVHKPLEIEGNIDDLIAAIEKTVSQGVHSFKA